MKFELDTSDKVFEVASVVFLLANIMIVSVAVPNLPDIIPFHFNLNGEPNQFGSKYIMWVNVAVSVLIYMLMGVVSKFPETFNYPSQKNNKEEQFKLGAKLMRSFRACVLLFLTIVTCVEIRSAYMGSAKGAIWLVGIVVIILAGNLIWFFTQWKKIK